VDVSERPIPDVELQFLAELLTARSDDFAHRAAEHLLAKHPSIARRYGHLAYEKWRDSLSGRLVELSAAINANSPALFTSQIAWSKVAFAARKVPLSDLTASLESLRDSIRRELDPGDAKVIDLYVDEAMHAVLHAPTTVPAALSVGTPHGRLAASYLVAILEGDRRRASQGVIDAIRRGLALEDVYLHVLKPVQCELGRMWHLGEITVAEEHFATATTQMVMAQALMYSTPKPSNGKTMLAASVDGNNHDLGVRMVADFFELDGWRVIYLGPSVPADDILAAVIDYHVDLVALSASMPSHLRQIEDAVRVIRSSAGPSGPKIMVGGFAFSAAPSMWRTTGADAFGADVTDSVRAGNALVGLGPMHG
jgi:MerR family transcriptional regulator, light-induced transcriptional regulator